MLLKFEKKVADFLGAIEFPFSKAGILLAVSGGADSIALLYILQALKSNNIFPGHIHCAHINHQLRTDANSDEEFVISQAEKLKIPSTTRRIDVRKYARENKLSIETAARKMRIENLTQIAIENKCSCIATGHQKNDNAETVIHRLLRGTGFRGLAGIWPIRKFDGNINYVRPLLCVTREEIVQYLQHKKLKWQEDYTNADCGYTRNHIRHILFPALQKDCTNSLTDQLFNLSLSANRFYKFVSAQADSLWPKTAQCDNEKVTLNLKNFSKQFPPIQLELIRRSLSHIGCGEADLTSHHYEKILILAKQNASGKILQLPCGFIIRKEYENIVFCKMDLSLHRSTESKSGTIKIPGRTIFDHFTVQASIITSSVTPQSDHRYAEQEIFDLDKIKSPVTIRLRKEGDRFVPLGQKGKKKIGKFLTAQHVQEEIRRKALVISDTEKIIWLYPIRISEQTKVTQQTRKILQLKII